MNDTLIAVDLAKSVFGVAVSHRPGKVSLRRRLSRDKFLAVFVQLPPATVVMEACGSAHHWAREIERLGHRVALLPPQHVRPYVLRNKTDRTDTKGLLEAYGNDDIRPVPIKTPLQQLLGSLHRLRSAGSRSVRPGSIPCAACSVNKASSSPSGPSTPFPTRDGGPDELTSLFS